MIYLDYSANTPVDEAVLERFCAVERSCPGNANSRHQAGEQRHQHGGSEHGEHVLHTQDQHPSGAQLSSVVYALGVIDLFTHGFVYLLRQPKKRGIAVVNGSAS